MQRFQDKVIIITGGARGIGQACAERFAAEGGRVAVLDLDETAAMTTAETLLDSGLAVQCDVTDRDSVQGAIEAVLAAWGRVDVLVANAGVYRGAPLPEVSLEDWRLVLAVNLTGVMLSCQAVAPTLMQQAGGSIVIMSSMGGKTSWPATAAYSASKSGELGLMRSVAQELGPHNVNCNAVCLGHADTEMMRAVDARICEENGWVPGTYLHQLAEKNPMRRLGTVEETAALVAFLASEEARYINGQAIEIDGGLLMC
ncbi:MAG: SDR family NAD(P)-dependent oxidoreductase [Anaerolineales bacterium]